MTGVKGHEGVLDISTACFIHIRINSLRPLWCESGRASRITHIVSRQSVPSVGVSIEKTGSQIRFTSSDCCHKL